MKLQKDYNLSKLNTFSISARAKFFAEITKEADLKELFNIPEFKNNKKLFLGGGSNILFTKDFDGLVVLSKLKGIKILKEDSKNVKIQAGSGEIWHDLVVFSVGHGYWGLENLALIPGTVGAAPMQNIGAYGAELKDVLEKVNVFDINTGEKKIFNKKECKLGYRDSIFKNELKDKYFISSITLKLSKTEKKNIAYQILQEYLKNNKIEVKNPKDISDAICKIRESKLPNPAIIPNAGSFFKNVFLPKEKLEELLKKYPDMPYFHENGSLASVFVKIPAGWLIEQCGPASGTSWKGYRMKNVGVHEKQALVLVNYGGATGEEILNLANKIMADVKEKFDLKLVPEVNIV